MEDLRQGQVQVYVGQEFPPQAPEFEQLSAADRAVLETVTWLADVG